MPGSEAKTERAPTGDPVARFSTVDLAPDDQFDAWREQLGPRFGIADVSRASAGSFAASIETIALSNILVSEVKADAMTFERTERHVSHRTRDEFTMGLLFEGSAVVEQDGRSAPIVEGDMVLCDNRRPYRLRFDGPFRQIIFHCDRGQLEARLPDAEHRTARPIRGQAGLPSAAAAYLAAIARERGDMAVAGAIVAQHAVDILSLALAGAETQPRPALFLARVCAYVEENLGDPDLTPGTIARRHRMSRRQLYRLFEESGETVSAFIRQRRLLRCKTALADEHQSKRSISEIAFAWGFNDASTFGRAFREAFGVSPKDFRSGRRSSGA